jgi:hypothetical protein
MVSDVSFFCNSNEGLAFRVWTLCPGFLHSYSIYTNDHIGKFFKGLDSSQNPLFQSRVFNFEIGFYARGDRNFGNFWLKLFENLTEFE